MSISHRAVARPLTVLSVLAAMLALAGAPASATYPGANGTIAFVRGGDIWLAAPDGSGQRNLTQTPSSYEARPSISPDGRSVAFQSATTSAQVSPQIDVMRLDGTGRRAVAVPGGNLTEALHPTWSPDGKQIALAGYHATERLSAVWIVPADGDGTKGRQLTSGYWAADPDWSVRGEIAVVARGSSPGLYAVDAVSGAARRLAHQSPYNYRHPSWSPDGARVVFGCDVSEQACEVNRDGSGYRVINHPSLSEGGSAPARRVTEPQYSPDGTRILFSGDDPHGDRGTHLHTVPVAGFAPDNSGATQLTSGPAEETSPSWGPVPSTTSPPPSTGAAATFDGNSATTERVGVSDPVAAAIAISKLRFPTGGVGEAGHPAQWVVLSRDDTFPDSLAGAGLTFGGPLLFSRSASLTPSTRAEISRVLAPGRVVYLLGGTSALSAGIESDLVAAGYRVQRLAGGSRVETALAVADEIRRWTEGGTQVLVARAFAANGNPTSGWADSVSGGALAGWSGVPVIVTPTEQVHPAVASWMRARGIKASYLLGGDAALSEAVRGQLPGAVRVSGPERTATAAAIARLWAVPTTDGERRFVVINGFSTNSWMLGLAAAGLSADHDAPLLMTSDRVPSATAPLVSACGEPEVDLVLVGDTAAIPTSIQQQLDALDGGSC